MAKTEAMDRVKTSTMDDGSDSPKSTDPILLSPISYSENGETYEISTDLIAIGGESQVYHATAKGTGAHCAAKIDISGLMYKPAERENRMQVIKFLRAHTDYRKYHIIPLWASGSVLIRGLDGMDLPYPIDIFPFCTSGDLDSYMKNMGKKFTYRELRDRVIPALSAALNTIHENNFIHRDIKPANIYEFDGEIVVSDFGTAVAVESDEDDTPRHTELARRTLGYSAPEINSRYAKKASDYFSLGCTLATLYNGKHPYETVLTKASDYAFYELVSEKGIAMDYFKGDEPLKHLIEALIRIKPSDRIKHDGVALWLADKRAFFDKHIASYSGSKARNDGQWKDPFNFEDADYWNEKDLAAAMASKWTEAKRYLYGGVRGEQGKTLRDFFKWNQTLQIRVTQIVEEAPTATNPDLGLSHFLHYLLKGGNLYWCGREYRNLAEIASQIRQHENKSGNTGPNFSDEIIKMLQSEYISWKLNATIQVTNLPEDTKAAIQNDLRGIMDIERIAQKYPRLAYYYAVYQWGEEPDLNLSGKYPDNVFFPYINKSPAVFYDAIVKLMNDDFRWATIAAMGFKEPVLSLKGKLGKNVRDNIEQIYFLFEGICNNKSAIRAHYYKNGPDSYLYWLKNNLSLYSFHSHEAQSLKTQIENVPFSDNMTLMELSGSFKELNGYFSEGGDFQTMFQSDFVIACTGLTKGKDRHGKITATHADAFFIDRFFGKAVPAGFRKSLGLSPEVGSNDELPI